MLVLNAPQGDLSRGSLRNPYVSEGISIIGWDSHKHTVSGEEKDARSSADCRPGERETTQVYPALQIVFLVLGLVHPSLAATPQENCSRKDACCLCLLRITSSPSGRLLGN